MIVIYVKCYFSYLAEVFEKIISNSPKNYELYPSDYLSTPALIWNAMLNMARVELGVFSDAVMYFLKKL